MPEKGGLKETPAGPGKPKAFFEGRKEGGVMFPHIRETHFASENDTCDQKQSVLDKLSGAPEESSHDLDSSSIRFRCGKRKLREVRGLA